jgi:hypothetical protein
LIGTTSTSSGTFLAYLVPLDVDVTGSIIAKLCEVWSEFNIFCTLVTMGMVAILKMFNFKMAAVAMETANMLKN